MVSAWCFTEGIHYLSNAAQRWLYIPSSRTKWNPGKPTNALAGSPKVGQNEQQTGFSLIIIDVAPIGQERHFMTLVGFPQYTRNIHAWSVTMVETWLCGLPIRPVTGRANQVPFRVLLHTRGERQLDAHTFNSLTPSASARRNPLPRNGPPLPPLSTALFLWPPGHEAAHKVNKKGTLLQMRCTACAELGKMLPMLRTETR